MRKIAIIIIFIFNCLHLDAQIVDSSYKAQTGEKVLQMSIVVPVSKDKAWKLFTEDALLIKWIAPVAHIELRNGGFIITNYDKSKSLSDNSSIKLGIINYLEKELITFKVELNDNFSKKAQNEDQNLQEIIQFIDEGNGTTKIISSMIGWGNGEDWDKTYNFFVRGNKYTYEEILKLF
jgi:uncharacterized protein YndB with AHSA1/START domain